MIQQILLFLKKLKKINPWKSSKKTPSPYFSQKNFFSQVRFWGENMLEFFGRYGFSHKFINQHPPQLLNPQKQRIVFQFNKRETFIVSNRN